MDVMAKYLLLMLVFISISGPVLSQQHVLYKQVDTISLYMDIYYPATEASSEMPAMVFFFGGGWVRGNINQFEPHAKYFASLGVVCFLVDYRVTDRHQSTPFESLKDAKSAMRFIRKKASELRIDPNKMIAAGGSAGGHLAAATALIEGFNEQNDDMTINCQPDALVLFNPILDNGPGGYGYKKIGEAYKDFSPLHNMHEGAPPTLIFQGTADKLVSAEMIEYFKTVMEKLGSKCEVVFFENEPHGFFNYKNTDNYLKTIKSTKTFLKDLGFMD